MSDLISRQAAIEAISYSEIAFYPGDNEGDCLRRDSDIKQAIMALPSAQPPQWIPCSERLPEDLEEVNVTWVNHNPEPCYNFVKEKPFTATAVYYNKKWYWYTCRCADLLAEYGRNPFEEIDDDIEITAWMPLPDSYKADMRGEQE